MSDLFEYYAETSHRHGPAALAEAGLGVGREVYNPSGEDNS
jgi:hypothetical protein